MDDNKSLELYKHVAAIHCSNTISLLQRKVFNVLLYNAYDRLLKDQFHYIPISELAKISGYTSNDTIKLKRALIALQSTVVEWNLIEKVNGFLTKEQPADIWCSSTLMASAMIDRSTKLCRYEYSKTLAEILYQPEVYTRIDLAIQARFRSSYALALYENCARFKNIKKTGWIDIVTFRKLMGVGPCKYLIFRDFNKRVLEPAVREVNQLSDIRIKPELRRAAQKVVAIKFSISSVKKTTGLPKMKTTNKVPDVIGSCGSNLKMSLTEKFNLCESDAQNIMNNHSEQYILDKIKLIESSQSYINGKVKSPAALLKTALKENYQINTNVGTALQKNSGQNIKDVSELRGKYAQQYESYCVDHAISKYKLLDKHKQQEIEAQFIKLCKKELSKQVLLETYKKYGLDSEANRADFSLYLIRAHPYLNKGMKSFDEFVTTNGPASEIIKT